MDDRPITMDPEFWVNKMDLTILDYLERMRDIIIERDRLRKENEDLKEENERLRKLLDAAFKGSQSIHSSWISALLDGKLEIAKDRKETKIKKK